MESISITFIFVSGLSSLIGRLFSGLLIFTIVFYVNRVNTSRHCRNIKKRYSDVKNNIEKFIFSFRVEDRCKLPDKVSQNTTNEQFIYFVFYIFVVCSACSFSIFTYQAYYYATLIYLKSMPFLCANQFMPLFSFAVIIPASIFSIFAHWSDVFSTLARIVKVSSEIPPAISNVGSEHLNVVKTLLIGFFMSLNLTYAGNNFKSSLSKHLHYLVLFPNSCFSHTPVMSFFVSKVMILNEVLKGSNFVFFLQEKGIRVIDYDEDSHESKPRHFFNLEKLGKIISDNTLFMGCSLAAACVKGHNVAKTAASFITFSTTFCVTCNSWADNIPRKANNTPTKEINASI